MAGEVLDRATVSGCPGTITTTAGPTTTAAELPLPPSG